MSQVEDTGILSSIYKSMDKTALDAASAETTFRCGVDESAITNLDPFSIEFKNTIAVGSVSITWASTSWRPEASIFTPSKNCSMSLETSLLELGKIRMEMGICATANNITAHNSGTFSYFIVEPILAGKHNMKSVKLILKQLYINARLSHRLNFSHKILSNYFLGHGISSSTEGYRRLINVYEPVPNKVVIYTYVDYVINTSAPGRQCLYHVVFNVDTFGTGINYAIPFYRSEGLAYLFASSLWSHLGIKISPQGTPTIHLSYRKEGEPVLVKLPIDTYYLQDFGFGNFSSGSRSNLVYCFDGLLVPGRSWLDMFSLSVSPIIGLEIRENTPAYAAMSPTLKNFLKTCRGKVLKRADMTPDTYRGVFKKRSFDEFIHSSSDLQKELDRLKINLLKKDIFNPENFSLFGRPSEIYSNSLVRPVYTKPLIFN